MPHTPNEPQHRPGPLSEFLRWLARQPKSPRQQRWAKMKAAQRRARG